MTTEAQRLSNLEAALDGIRKAVAVPKPHIYYDLTHATMHYGKDESVGRGPRVYASIPGMVGMRYLYLDHFIAKNDDDQAEVQKYGRSLLGTGVPVYVNFNERILPSNEKWWLQQECWHNDKNKCRGVINRYRRLLANLRSGNPGLEVSINGVIPPAERHVEPQWRPLIREYTQAIAPLVRECSFVLGSGYTEPGETMAKWEARIEDELVEVAVWKLKSLIQLKPHIENPPDAQHRDWWITPNKLFAEQLKWVSPRILSGELEGAVVWCGGVDVKDSGEKELREYFS